MKIQTFNIVAGTKACNANCSFCVSKMTGFEELPKKRAVNWRNFYKALKLAELGGTTTALITGKGEPTLYPEEISNYLIALRDSSNIPLVELQTNGLTMGWLAEGKKKSDLTEGSLKHWYSAGLDTIAISIVSPKHRHNAKVYHKDYPDLERTCNYLHEIGFSIRLCLMMQKSYTYQPEQLRQTVDFCRENGIEQLTARPLRYPTESHNAVVINSIIKEHLTQWQIQQLQKWAEENGTLLMNLVHGAKVYDVKGQNLCLSDCLTLEPDNETIRSLIFYSNGRISYDWQYKGAVILGGK